MGPRHAGGRRASGSHVALAIPNSQDLVLGTLGCWKIGAVPIPMRWDIPDWERTRLLDVIKAALVVDEHTRADWLPPRRTSPTIPSGSVVADSVWDLQ